MTGRTSYKLSRPILIVLSLIVLVLAAVLVVLWLSGAPFTEPKPPGEALTPLTEPGYPYGGLVWFEDNWLVTTKITGDKIFSNQIQMIKADGSQIITMPEPSLPECDIARVGTKAQFKLPDSQFGYLAFCGSINDSGSGHYLMMAHDLKTGVSSQLLPYLLPNRVPSGDIAWREDMSEAYSSNGVNKTLGEQLIRYSTDGIEPFDVGLPQAVNPVWSPDNDRLVFVGAATKGTVFGSSPLYDIYWIDPLLPKELHRIAGGFVDILGMDWSPDGKWLVIADYGPNRSVGGQGKLLLLEFDTGRITVLGQTRKAFGSPKWSPDGKQIAYVFTEWQNDGDFGSGMAQIFVINNIDDYRQ